jgi:hypothetical protein
MTGQGASGSQIETGTEQSDAGMRVSEEELEGHRRLLEERYDLLDLE